MISPPWGAYPGSNLLDVKSGIGFVHNSYLLDRVEKSVLEGPLVNFPPPVWFPDHKNAAGVANALIHLYERPSVLRLPRLGLAAVRGFCLLLGVLLAWGSAAQAAEKEAAKPAEFQATTHTIQATGKAQFELQAALINAVPGDVIELAAGKYDFTSELNVVCDNVTLRGAGRDKTVINFKKQSAGSSGLLATGNAFVIEGLTIQDTVGSGIKVLGAQDVIFRDVKVEWTEGEKSTNGAYGIYPVECKNVLIENCVSIGASDAGIYVGQSQDVIVRGCLATRNVTGIEIENTLRADVYDNVATDNTGGIMVFDLPGLNLVNGGYVRVYKNNVKENNHANFAPLGTVVADVPPGTGVMILAMDNVEVFDNDITGHLTNNVMILSYLIVERKDLDKKFDPYPEIISIHDNRISGGGKKPSGKISMALLPIAGGKFPDIFYDGILNPSPSPEVQKLGKYSIRIRDNGDAT
jgi:parallel beta-helix repeat protein